MQAMAKLLKDKNVLQMNIIDPKKEKSPTKSDFVEYVQEDTDNERNVGGNDIKISKRNIVTTNKIKLNDPGDIVFAILSEDAKKKALESVLLQNIPGPEKRKRRNGIKKDKTFDSVTFLLHSGYSKEHFDRLLSKVLQVIFNYPIILFRFSFLASGRHSENS